MIKIFILFMAILFPISAFADSRLDNCLPYKEEISSILESEGVSSDYFYLAVCESGCKIKTSSKGARGFFQVMPYTFSVYKDDSCTDIDNIRCNTIAAARYIKHLQKRFKEISILVKAYNRGGTNLLRKGSTREADGLSYCVMNHLSNEKNN
jgi:hypothetical protein